VGQRPTAARHPEHFVILVFKIIVHIVLLIQQIFNLILTV